MQPLNKVFFPDEYLFGGTGLPVLCWGTGSLANDDATIQYDDPLNGGGVFVPLPDKIGILDQLLNKADAVLFADGSLQEPKRLGIRYIRSFTWLTSRVNTDWINFRAVLNKHLASGKTLTLYPSGHHLFSFECFISKLSSSALNDSQLAESIQIEFTAKEVTSKLNDIVITESLTVDVPNGGEVYPNTPEIIIQFTYSGSKETLKLEKGKKIGFMYIWSDIYPDLPSTETEYYWYPAPSEYGQYKVRISENGGSLTDMSDADFTIQAPA